MQWKMKKPVADEPVYYVPVWERFLIFLGRRSYCCAAKVEVDKPFGWPPRATCSLCKRRLW